MPKARKLPSGNWNAQVLDYTDEAGKRHFRSFTAPTKAEAQFLAAQYKAGKARRFSAPAMTVGDAVERYLQMRAVLSPTTTSAYRHGMTDGFTALQAMKVRDLTDEIVQQEITAETRRISGKTGRPISAKTVHNEWGTISAALKAVCGLTFNVRLPKAQPKQKTLSPAARVLDAIRGTEIELPCLLAMWRSLRTSEIRGLMFSDLQDGILTVNRVKVDVDGAVVVKNTTKTDTSRRSFPVPGF